MKTVAWILMSLLSLPLPLAAQNSSTAPAATQPLVFPGEEALPGMNEADLQALQDSLYRKSGELFKQYQAEQDPARKNEIFEEHSVYQRQGFAAEQALGMKKAEPLMKQWLAESDPVKKKQLREEIFHLLRYSERIDLIEMLQAGGPLKDSIVQILQPAEALTVSPALEEPIPWKNYETVVRRINDEYFEIWNRDQGLLFNTEPRLVNHATVPRKAGRGRDWHGAFLPDGRWVTTDIDEYDRTLTFFSREGKWLREIKTDKILPITEELFDSDAGLIDWARSDAQGTGWVLRISHTGAAWISPEGKSRKLKGAEPWQLCRARDLGSRAWAFIDFAMPDDTGDYFLMLAMVNHGPMAMYSTLTVVPASDLKGTSLGWERDETPHPDLLQMHLYGAERNMGFWPNSTDLFVEANDKTWFFDKSGGFQGIIEAMPLGEAASGEDLLFLTQDGRVVTLGKDLKPSAVRRFMIEPAKSAEVLAIYDDINTGVFKSDGRTFVGKW